MISLPKTKRDPKKNDELCRCRPVCKSRRREWHGQIQPTSKELLLCRKPIPECFRRRPTEVYPNGPCPLRGWKKHVTVNERNAERKAKVVRICQAPLDVDVETPYLDFIAEAYRLGALPLPERICCAFCKCGACCDCTGALYVPQDAERVTRRREHMPEFDARVRCTHQDMRIMYDEIK